MVCLACSAGAEYGFGRQKFGLSATVLMPQEAAQHPDWRTEPCRTAAWASYPADFLYVYDAASGELLGKKSLRSFPHAANAVGLLSADIDSAAGEEILVSTCAGYVVWFRQSELLTSGTAFPTSGAGWGITDRSNLSVAATWAMTIVNDKLQLVDQAGSHYEVEPATGNVTWKQWFGTPGPHRSLVHVGPLHGPPPVPAIPLSEQTIPCWVFNPGPGYSLAQIGRYANSPPLIANGPDTNLLYKSVFLNEYWLPSAGGATYTEPSGSTRCWWWSNSIGEYLRPLAREIVLGARIDGPSGARMLQDVLSTSQGSWSGRHRLRSNMNGSGVLETGDLQGLRVGHVRGNADPEVVLSTVGGSVLLLAGGQQQSRPDLLGESADYGWGGVALALSDLDGDSEPEVLHGTLFANQRFANDQQVATLQILKGSSLALANSGSSPFAFDSHTPAYPVVGIAGIAMGDAIRSLPGNELVVTTIDGYLLVFGVSNVGGVGGASFQLNLLCSVAGIGALGAHSSIHIGDYATNGALTGPPDLKSEIYVAGSLGVRRYDVGP
jgi:hypothetical protein